MDLIKRKTTKILVQIVEIVCHIKNLFHSFFMPIVRSDLFRNIIFKIIEQLRNRCEDKALHLLNRFHGDTYVKIMHIFTDIQRCATYSRRLLGQNGRTSQ